MRSVVPSSLLGPRGASWSRLKLLGAWLGMLAVFTISLLVLDLLARRAMADLRQEAADLAKSVSPPRGSGRRKRRHALPPGAGADEGRRAFLHLGLCLSRGGRCGPTVESRPRQHYSWPPTPEDEAPQAPFDFADPELRRVSRRAGGNDRPAPGRGAAAGVQLGLRLLRSRRLLCGP